MSKDNDWIINSQREAAKKIEAEKASKTEAEQKIAREKKAAADEELRKKEIAEQVLKDYFLNANKYLAELKKHGYIVSSEQDVTSFSIDDGHAGTFERFTAEELEEAARRMGKTLPSSARKGVTHTARHISPLIKINKSEIDIGFDRTSSAWEAPAVKISIGKSKKGPTITSKAQVSTVTDFVYDIEKITEDRGSGKSSYQGDISTKIMSETQQPPCIVVESYLAVPSEYFPSGTVRNYTELPQIVAYTPAEFDSLFKDFLVSSVASLEELHIRQQEEKKVDRKKRWGF